MTRSMLAPTIFLALGLLVAAPARASAPELISYQGVLTLENGVVVDDGTYTLRFRILDSPEPGQGQVKFEQELSVQTTNGLYNVILSSHDTQSLADAFDEPQRFMEVTILGAGPGGGDVTLLPRQRIASVPYALQGGIPTGSIILWDSPEGCGGAANTCPCGYAEVTALRNRMVRGADSSTPPTNSAIPDVPGVSCPGGVGCSAADGRYNDVLEVEELAPHKHAGFGESTGDFPLGQVGPQVHRGSHGGVDDDNYLYETTEVGDGEPHYHPFRSVLFCRKD